MLRGKPSYIQTFVTHETRQQIMQSVLNSLATAESPTVIAGDFGMAWTSMSRYIVEAQLAQNNISAHSTPEKT